MITDSNRYYAWASGIVVLWLVLIGYVPSLSARAEPGVDAATVSAATGDALNARLLGHIGGATNAVYVQGNRAYVGEGPSLTILDVTDPFTPIVLGRSAALSTIVEDIMVVGATAYIATGPGGLSMVDVTNPTNPAEVGFIKMPGVARSVYVDGDFAYVAAEDAGLRVVNVSDRAHPTAAGFYDTPGTALSLFVTTHPIHGRFAYIADRSSGLHIVDVTDPNTPKQGVTYDIGDHLIYDVVVVGDYAYVADEEWYVRVLNVANPKEQPVEVGHFSTGGPVGVFVQGGLLYVADSSGLWVASLEDPTSPELVDTWSMPNGARAVFVVGSTAYVVTDAQGLQIVDVTRPTMFTKSSSYSMLVNTYKVFVDNQKAYVLDGTHTLRILDVSNPTLIESVGLYQSALPIYRLYVAGDYAYISHGTDGVRVLNVQNSAQVQETGFYDTPGQAQALYALGNQLYVADGNQGLLALNVSDMGGLTLNGSVSIPGVEQGIYGYPATGLIYLADAVSNDVQRGLRLANMSDLSPAGFYPTAGFPQSVAAKDNYAYVVDQASLRIIDVLQRPTLTQVGILAEPNYDLRDIAVNGNNAYLASVGGATNGLRLVDVSRPTAPHEFGFYNTPGYASDLFVDSGTAYVADSDGGLFIIRPCYKLTLTHTGNGADPVITTPSSPLCGAGEYLFGDNVSVRAAPETNWRIAGWAGTHGNTSATDNTLTMPAANHTVTVTYTTTTCYGLTLAHTGNGSDPWVKSGDSQGCPPGQYAAGVFITLSATPETDWRIVNWTGTGSDNTTSTTTTLTMPAANHTVTVNYITTACYGLTFAHTGNGSDPTAKPTNSVGCPPGQYSAADFITLSAEPDVNWRIANWTGTGSDNTTSTTSTLTMPAADHTVTVHYATTLCYGLTFAHTGNGSDPWVKSGDAQGCPPGQYAAGVFITLSTEPDPNWWIARWVGTHIDSTTSPTNTLTMPAANHKVTVEYSDCVRLTVRRAGHGLDLARTPTRSAGCSEDAYVPGQLITLVASPNPHWRIAGWVGTASDNTILTENRLTMPAAHHDVTVLYAPICYPLTFTHSGNGSDPLALPAQSAGCPPGQYAVDESISVRADGVAGWQVGAWHGTLADTGIITENVVTMPASAHRVDVAYVENATALAPGDAFEQDDACSEGRPIASNGSRQTHTIHRPGDTDWVRYAVKSGEAYQIEVMVPPGSHADIQVGLYNDCVAAPLTLTDRAFAPGVLINHIATITGTVYLQLAHNKPEVGGDGMAYQVTVQRIDPTAKPGVVVIVAGRKGTNVQAQINGVAEDVYRYFRAKGYPDDDIQVLATSSIAGYDEPATAANLRRAITEWARLKVSADRPLILYMVDHGGRDLFYIDNDAERVTPADIDTWLSELENAVRGLQVTVVIEACHSGSFIKDAPRISKVGRVVITSTSVDYLAYASSKGAYFSDSFVSVLSEGYGLQQSFLQARATVHYVRGSQWQDPWIDGDGNGIANEAADLTPGVRRDVAPRTSFTETVSAPYIRAVQGPSVISGGRGLVTATVQDDKAVAHVWAVVYPPSYMPPADSDLLTEEGLPTLELAALGQDEYRMQYPLFTEIGIYRVAVYAEDDAGLQSTPFVIDMPVGQRIFLPIVRQ